VTQTRRELLVAGFTLPLLKVAPSVAEESAAAASIVCGSDCLSQESAAGFRILKQSMDPALTSGVLVFCGMPDLNIKDAQRMRELAISGALVLCELSPFAHRLTGLQAFGMAADAPVAIGPGHTDRHGLFVRYRWPHAALVRSFLGFVPLSGDGLLSATYGGHAVAMRRQIGRGAVIVLGSMLGPSLFAGDSQAREVAAETIEFAGIRSSGTVFAGTSKTACTNT
jgi:hypothetical protein